MILLALAQEGWYIIEQPLTSCMDMHDVLKFLESLWTQFCFPWVGGYHIAHTYMGAFGADTIKPHKLISNRWWAFGLSRDKPSLRSFESRRRTYTSVITEDSAGNRKRAITGTKELKGTEEYTDEFGVAFADLFADYQVHIADEIPVYNVDDFDKCPISFTVWRDLELSTCLRNIRSEPSNTD